MTSGPPSNTALLQHVGCTGYAHETARVFGDELALNVAAGRQDPADPRDLFAPFLPLLTRGRPPLERAPLVLATVTLGGRFANAYTTAAWGLPRRSSAASTTSTRTGAGEASRPAWPATTCRPGPGWPG